MPKQVSQIIWVFIAAFIFTRCAQVVPLSGGKRDTAPPKLLNAVPANKSTGFSAGLIVLEFDEYVKVSDLANQLTVSPKLKTAPEVETDRKSLRITLKKEELAPNTTYRFSFGKAIVDMHEGNPLQDFSYVFSTGSTIDSLKINGTATDAFTGKASAGVLVGLYMNAMSDSLPYKEAPDYTGKSNDDGEFHFTNLPGKTFRAYAFEDKNKNGHYDGETEKIAFLDSDLTLTTDTSLKFHLFQEEASKSFIKKNLLPYYGLVQVLLNKKAVNHVMALNKRDSAGIFETRPGVEKDTIAIYYKDMGDTLGLALQSNNKTDTLKIALPKKPAAKKKFKGYAFNVSANTLSLNTPLIVTFSNWMNIQKTETANMRLSSREDSAINAEPVKGRWLDVNRYEINNTLKEAMSYTFKIDTCAFFDATDVCNAADSISFKPESRIEFGKVTLKLLLNKKQAYIIRLINERQETVKESPVTLPLAVSNAVTVDFTDVRPGSYLVKIIYDNNANGKWDTGKLLLKQQPEQVIIHSKQIKVLSDWEIEEEISIKE